jgi:hypothetical protein
VLYHTAFVGGQVDAVEQVVAVAAVAEDGGGPASTGKVGSYLLDRRQGLVLLGVERYAN